MGLAHDAISALGHALEHVHAGSAKLASRKLADGMSPRIAVKSTAFGPYSPLPVSCTSDGLGSPPPLAWGNVPVETRSIVVLCEDPDAPFPEPFVHWMVYGIPASVWTLDAQSCVTWRQGKNSKLAEGFTPAAPPPGHGVHHYHFQVFALDIGSELHPNMGRGALFEHMKGHVIGWGELVGTYERK